MQNMWPCMEGTVIPPEHIDEFVRELNNLFEEYNVNILYANEFDIIFCTATSYEAQSKELVKKTIKWQVEHMNLLIACGKWEDVV